MTQHRPISTLTGCLVAALTVSLAGCGGGSGADAAATPEPTPTATATAETTEAASPETTETETADVSGLPTVPGYDVGEVPPIPLMVMPDMSLLDDSMSTFAVELRTELVDVPGVTVSAATCNEYGEYTAGNSTLVAYGDGHTQYTGPDGEVVNYGDGSGTFTAGGVTVTNYGDGTASYEGNGIEIWNYGDGSGYYLDDQNDIWVYGDGSGHSYTPAGDLDNYGDGSGSFTSGGVTIWNYGDGSASYEGPGLTVWNYGDGTGMVNGTRIEVDAVPSVPPIGVFPPLDALAPQSSCGTRISLDSGVLFDIDQWDIRPDAAAALDALGVALVELDAPNLVVEGHTDSVRSHEHNQTLSENRAASVADALAQRGVTATMETAGYGETRPVAPETIDGVDSPAGRQANRRVEIIIPAF